MSQQAAIISGVPKLNPLPTYQSQIVDECYSYTPTPEPELRYTPEIEQEGFPFSRGGTPQTPSEPFGCNQPLSVVDDMYLDCAPWSSDSLVPVGLGFEGLDCSMGDWMTPDPTCTSTPEPDDLSSNNFFAQTEFPPIPTLPPALHSFDALAPAETWPFDLPAQQDILPDISAAKINAAGLDSGIVMQTEWPQPLPQPQSQHTQSARGDLFVDMGLVTSAPYVPKMQGLPGAAPVWEDVFMPGALAY